MDSHTRNFAGEPIFAITFSALALCACQNKLLNEYNNRETVEKISAEYNEAWVEAFGEVAADQSWDFTSPMPVVGPEEGVLDPEETGTKVQSASGVVANPGEVGYWEDNESTPPLKIRGLKPVVTLGEIAYLKTAFPAAEPMDWDPNQFAINDMWHYYTHTPFVMPDSDDGYGWYSLALTWYNRNDGTYNGTEYVAELPFSAMFSIGAVTNAWYAGSAYNGKKGGRRIITTDFDGMENIYWYAYDQDDEIYDTSLDNSGFILDKYTEVVTPSGAKYWGFDCDHDGTCYDLVMLIEPSFRQTKTVRYLIEDLGSIGDFDFNDVVVDVTSTRTFTNVFDGDGNPVPEYGEWEQSAVIRALGGTLDFTLTIGDTSWKKSDHFNSGDMANNGHDVNSAAELAKFDVTGWDFDAHNISLTVRTGSSNGVKTITFPKAGTVPVIIAVDPTVGWSIEGHTIPSSWFTEE